VSLTREALLNTLARVDEEGIRLTELGALLELRSSERQDLRKLLGALVSGGQVEKVGRGRYRLPPAGGPAGGDGAAQRAAPSRAERGRRSAAASDDAQATGRIRVHPAGYGFVEREDGLGDVFVPAKFRGAALDGDRVRVATWAGYKGTEGRVEEVLSRGRAKLTGVVQRAGRAFYVEPDDPRIAANFGHIQLEQGAGKARIGQAVLLEITQYPTTREPRLAGRVTHVLGDPEDPRTEIAKIIACGDIPAEFPADALAQAETTPDALRTADLADRIDLRDRSFLTIDPETARDFDDALCIETGPHGGPRVWVAVADVSHYVHAGDPLDAEAQIRGVSVYLPDRVIPMLPLQLSAGICSLNPNVDRCAMVVRLDYDQGGNLVDRGYAAAVIRSRARLDYPGVAAALSGDFRGRRESYRRWEGHLQRLYKLSRMLRQRRLARGALDLEIPEAKVVLDDDDPRLVRDVVRAKSSEAVKSAYQLVEEYMIAANEAVGRFFNERGLVSVWRVHAPPDGERLTDLAETLNSFGIRIDVAEAQTPLGMRRVLEEIGERPAARALSFLLLRSLKQAEYDTQNIGHFGLASGDYLHFTSPIRRYPDLLVHRLLKYHLHREGQASGGAGRGRPPEEETLAQLAADSSSHERRAIEAEREAVGMYRAYLCRDRVGEEFTGTVSAVTGFGVFVELDEPFIEGLIKLDDLGDDRFEVDLLRARVAGRRSGLSLTLGDRVTVELINASVVRRQVDLRLARVDPGTALRVRPERRSSRRPGRTERRSTSGRAQRRDKRRR
jgi:ribonuclease R